MGLGICSCSHTCSDVVVFSELSENQLVAISHVSFGYFFEHNGSSAQATATMYCLELFGKDPEPDFFESYKENNPPVGKASDFKGHQGMILFKITDIDYEKEGMWRVKCQYHEGGLSAAWYKMWLNYSCGKWKVISMDCYQIS